MDAVLRADSAWLPSFGDELIVSYSQNAEDVRLWRVFRTIEGGFYVDIGAADPRVDSVTHLFYEHGWSGINVEPSPCFEALEKARPRDVNLNVAVGDGEGPVSFFLTQPYLGLSTFRPLGACAGRRRGEGDRGGRGLAASTGLDPGGTRSRPHDPFPQGRRRRSRGPVLASSDWATFRPAVVVVESIASLSATSTTSGGRASS